MTPLELKKTKLELLKVSAAKAEIEFRIDERLDEIERLKQHVKVQEEKEQELMARIEEAEKAIQ